MNITVLIADDHRILMAGLASLLESAGGIQVVGQANDGDQAAGMIAKCKPDVAVVDVAMPSGGAEAVAKFVVESQLKTRVIALTAHTAPAVITRVIEAGAVGYVHKQSAFEDLVKAIKHVASGGTFISPDLAAEILQYQGQNNKLTPREREVLRGIADGLAYKQIATRLDISVRTVETYRHRLLKKLGLKTTADLIRYASRADD
ncbi:MAG: response regulator transcription factor [Planctomycetota bacterium]